MKCRTVLLVAILTLVAGLLAVPVHTSAQAGGQQTAYETRPQLQEKARQLEGRLAKASSDERADVRRRLQRVRQRLEQGDFQAGDLLEMRVSGSDELSGSFRVAAGPTLQIPPVGELDLSGVLYAEADSVVRRHLQQYVKTEQIRIRPLKRVAVLGAVGEPGFYDLPPTSSVSDAIMQAGGPVQESDLDKLKLRREGRTVLSAEEGSLRESATLAEIGAERGDQLFVPERGGGLGLGGVMAIVGGISSLAFAASTIF